MPSALLLLNEASFDFKAPILFAEMASRTALALDSMSLHSVVLLSKHSLPVETFVKAGILQLFAEIDFAGLVVPISLWPVTAALSALLDADVDFVASMFVSVGA